MDKDDKGFGPNKPNHNEPIPADGATGTPAQQENAFDWGDFGDDDRFWEDIENSLLWETPAEGQSPADAPSGVPGGDAAPVCTAPFRDGPVSTAPFRDGPVCDDPFPDDPFPDDPFCDDPFPDDPTDAASDGDEAADRDWETLPERIARMRDDRAETLEEARRKAGDKGIGPPRTPRHLKDAETTQRLGLRVPARPTSQPSIYTNLGWPNPVDLDMDGELSFRRTPTPELPDAEAASGTGPAIKTSRAEGPSGGEPEAKGPQGVPAPRRRAAPATAAEDVAGDGGPAETAVGRPAGLSAERLSAIRDIYPLFRDWPDGIRDRAIELRERLIEFRSRSGAVPSSFHKDPGRPAGSRGWTADGRDIPSAVADRPTASSERTAAGRDMPSAVRDRPTASSERTVAGRDMPSTVTDRPTASRERSAGRDKAAGVRNRPTFGRDGDAEGPRRPAPATRPRFCGSGRAPSAGRPDGFVCPAAVPVLPDGGGFCEPPLAIGGIAWESARDRETGQARRAELVRLALNELSSGLSSGSRSGSAWSGPVADAFGRKGH
ncbi:MAG: hypothetical protein LBT40_12750 [Deltaproteobacteria bacterium]|jgi:hypothetical protein|nr:hypothetical protein [Deltaproteobacteria bacterium]